MIESEGKKRKDVFETERELQSDKSINELFDERIEHQRINKYGKLSKVRTI